MWTWTKQFLERKLWSFGTHLVRIFLLFLILNHSRRYLLAEISLRVTIEAQAVSVPGDTERDLLEGFRALTIDEDVFDMDIDGTGFALPPVGPLLLPPVLDEREPMDIDDPDLAAVTLTSATGLDQHEPMDVEATGPIPTLAPALEEREPIVCLEQALVPFLGTRSETYLNAPTPSLIGEYIEAGAENALIPYNWDFQGLIPTLEGAPEAEGTMEELSMAVIPVRSEQATRSPSLLALEWRDSNMIEQHEEQQEVDPDVENLTESLRLLEINEDTIPNVLPSVDRNIAAEVAHDAAVTSEAAATQPHFQIFSNLESTFDDKKFTYLSNVHNCKPPDLLFPSKPDINVDASPGSTDWFVERLKRLGERLGRKMAERTRALKTPRRRRLRCLDPFGSTTCVFDFLFSLETTPLKSPAARRAVRHKQIVSDGAFKDLSAHIPILQWTDSSAERQVRDKTANPECSIESIPSKIDANPASQCLDENSGLSVPPECIDQADVYSATPCPEYSCPNLLLDTDEFKSDFLHTLSPHLDSANPKPGYIFASLFPWMDDALTRRVPDSIYVPRTTGLVLQPLSQVPVYDRFPQVDCASESPETDLTEVDIPLPVDVSASSRELQDTCRGCISDNLTTPKQMAKKPDDDPVFPGAYPTDELEDSDSSNSPNPMRSASFFKWVIELISGW